MYYIGMHSTTKLNDGYIGSGKVLWYSINKYGKDNHKKEILEFLVSREELKKRENEIVNEELLKDKLCMNINIGGHGGWSSKQQKNNNKKSLAKQKILRETNKEWVSIRSANTSKGLKLAYKEGRKIINMPDRRNRPHTIETKIKIGLANSIHQKGELNSQYGTCWIFDIEKQKAFKIKKHMLDFYLKNEKIRKGRK